MVHVLGQLCGTHSKLYGCSCGLKSPGLHAAQHSSTGAAAEIGERMGFIFAFGNLGRNCSDDDVNDLRAFLYCAVVEWAHLWCALHFSDVGLFSHNGGCTRRLCKNLGCDHTKSRCSRARSHWKCPRVAFSQGHCLLMLCRRCRIFRMRVHDPIAVQQ